MSTGVFFKCNMIFLCVCIITVVEKKKILLLRKKIKIMRKQRRKIRRERVLLFLLKEKPKTQISRYLSRKDPSKNVNKTMIRPKPVNIYQFKVVIKILEKGVKHSHLSNKTGTCLLERMSKLFFRSNKLHLK